VPIVVAASFARIFLRNAINVGLPVVESPEAAAAIRDGDHLRIDLAGGTIDRAGDRWTISAQPPFLAELIDAGGLVAWTRRRLAAQTHERHRPKGPPE
jgi:3-isopropylmalate dehydratase small subunit